MNRQRVRRHRHRQEPPFLQVVAEWLENRGPLAVLVLLALVVGGSVLAVGTVHVPVLLVVAAGALLAGVVALLVPPAQGALVPWPALLLALLALWSALQALPLPFAWLVRIAPASAEVWAGSLRPFGEPAPGWASISVDPGASRVEALKWLCYAAVFVAAVLVGRHHGRRAGVALVFGAALAAALVSIGHGLVGATSLYGLYQPSTPRSEWRMSPLLNPNNFAGYMNLGAFSGFGLLVARRSAAPRWLVGLGVATILGASFISASRGGWAALLLGIVLLFVTLGRVVPRARHRAAAGRLLWVQLGLVSGFGLVLFLLGATEAIWAELLDESLQKLALLDWSRPLLLAHLWFGVGRGGFETAFIPYRGNTGHHIYQHAENFVVEWCAEWGLPVGLVALGGLGWMLRPRRLGADRDPVAASSLVGVVVLLGQNLLDLGLEIPSVAIALFCLLGVLWGSAAATGVAQQTQATLEERRSRLPALALALVGAVALVGATSSGRYPALRDREQLARALESVRPSSPGSYQAFRAELHKAMERHPADAFLPLLGGLAAHRMGQNPLPWIGRALERDPMAGRPHLLLARVLKERGATGQALLSLRMAVEREPALVGHVAELALRITRDEALLRVAPEGAAGAPVLVEIAARLPATVALRQRLIDEAVQRDPRLVRPRLLRAERWLNELGSTRPDGPCSGSGRGRCLRALEEEAQRIAEADPGSDHALILRARVLLVEGQPEAAARKLATGCRRTASTECLRWRVIAASSSKNSSDLEPAVASYLAASCSNSATCAAAARWAADLYARRGDWLGAVTLYERAARESGSAETWLKLADAARRAGLYSRAARALERARQGGALSVELEQQVERARREQLLADPK